MWTNVWWFQAERNEKAVESSSRSDMTVRMWRCKNREFSLGFKCLRIGISKRRSIRSNIKSVLVIS